MSAKDLSEYAAGKTFDEILHEGREESAERILSEALTPLALLLSRELLKVLMLPPRTLEELVTSPLRRRPNDISGHLDPPGFHLDQEDGASQI